MTSKSVMLAVVLGLAVTAPLLALLYGMLGWLGVGILGMAGLFISSRIELQGGYVVFDASHVETSVNLLARQMEARQRQTRDQKREEAENRAERTKWLYVLNTICLALALLGFTMFVRYQL